MPSSKDWNLGYSWFCSGLYKSCPLGCSDDVYAGWSRAAADKALRHGVFYVDPVVSVPVLGRPLRSYGSHRG